MDSVRLTFTDEPEHEFSCNLVNFTQHKTVESILTMFVNDYNQKNGLTRLLETNSLRIEREHNQILKDEDILAIAPGENLRIIYFVPKGIRFMCGNLGCSTQFLEEENTDTACQFHISSPLFHEGLKSWPCCSKKMTDFDQFLAIPGCACGRHKPLIKKLPKPKEVVSNMDITTDSTGKETYVDKNARKPVPQSIVLQKENSKSKLPPGQSWSVDEEKSDPSDAVIAVGTTCTHNGCKATFQDDSSRTEICHYHPGPPLFHEGSKGWDCCRKKSVLEFAEFLKIEGCREGKHKFISEPAKIHVRHDYYQMGMFVNISFYSKNVKKHESSLTFEPNCVHVKLALSNGDVFQTELILAREIVPEQCKFEIMSTKVEIKLKKSSNRRMEHVQAL